MRSLLPLWLLLLIGWIAFCTWWWFPTCCGVAGAAATTTNSAAATAGATSTATTSALKASSPWVISDGSTTVARSEDNFTFNKSGFQPSIPAPTEDAFGKVATYLKGNANKKIALTGYYASDEKYNGALANLGVARADALKNKLVALGANADQITTIGRKRDPLPFEKDKIWGHDAVKYSFKSSPAANANNRGTGAGMPSVTLKIDDGTGDTFNVSKQDNTRFARNAFEYKKPLPIAVNDAYKKVGEHLNKHPNKRLTVTGVYGKDEENKSMLSNLGLARANNVKQAIVKAGAKKEQIDIAAREIPSPKFDNDELIGGIDYTFKNVKDTKASADADAAKLKEIEAKLRIGPRTLYFETNKSSLIMSSEDRQYFTDLVYYLERTGGGRSTVVGHTDSRGDANANKRLAQNRANFVKEYMAKNGIKASQILPSSKGELEPIETNDTNEGRAKNRRVVVSLK